MAAPRLIATCAFVLTLSLAAASSATTWQDGDLLTGSQSAWGDDPNVSNLASVLVANFDSVYTSTPFVGSLSRFAIFFGSAATLNAYLPANGTPNPIDQDYVDPTTTASGQFGGDVWGLKLNVDFSDAGLLPGTAPYHFGDLTLYGLTNTADLNDLTVRQVLAALNSALCGLPTSDSYADLDEVARELNASFGSGPSQWAQDHLAAPVPEPATLLLLGSSIAAVATRCRKRA